MVTFNNWFKNLAVSSHRLVQASSSTVSRFMSKMLTNCNYHFRRSLEKNHVGSERETLILSLS